MTGALFAILGAICFSCNSITTRRAVASIGNAAAGVFITVPMAIPLFLLILLGLGKIDKLTTFTWQGYLFLAAAGFVHFVLGRSMNYQCTQLVGSNVRGILTKLAPLTASTLGIILFQEPLTWRLVLGIGLIMGGILVIGWGRARAKTGVPGGPAGIPLKGILYGLGSGIFWGISPILTTYGLKAGLGGHGDPTAAVLISYIAATVGMSPFLVRRGLRNDLKGMSKQAFLWFAVTTVLVALAQLFRYIALSKAPVSVVSPLFSIDPVIVIMLSFIFNRRLEIFSWQVIVGAITTATGAFFII